MGRRLILLLLFIPLVSFGQTITYSKDYMGNTVAKDQYGNIIATGKRTALGDFETKDQYGNIISRSRRTALGDVQTTDQYGNIISRSRGTALGDVQTTDQYGNLIGTYKNTYNGNVEYQGPTYSNPTYYGNVGYQAPTYSNPTYYGNVRYQAPTYSNPYSEVNTYPKTETYPQNNYNENQNQTTEKYQAVPQQQYQKPVNIYENIDQLGTDVYSPSPERNKKVFKKLKVILLEGFGSLNIPLDNSNGQDPMFLGQKLFSGLNDKDIPVSPNSPYKISFQYEIGAPKFITGPKGCGLTLINQLQIEITDIRNNKKIGDITFSQRDSESKCIDDVVYQTIEKLISLKSNFQLGEYENYGKSVKLNIIEKNGIKYILNDDGSLNMATKKELDNIKKYEDLIQVGKKNNRSDNKPCYIEKNGVKYIEDKDGTLTLAPFNVTEKCE